MYISLHPESFRGYTHEAVLERLDTDAQFAELTDRLAAEGGAAADGLWGSFAPMLAVGVSRRLQRPLLYLTAHLEQADDIRDDLELFSGLNVELFAAWESIGWQHSAADEILGARLRICRLLRENGLAATTQQPFLLTAPIHALMQPVPDPDTLTAHCLSLKQGGQLPPRKLTEWLSDHRYEAVDQIDAPGQFAHRGGIVDFFAIDSPEPVRVEYFGDHIESLRKIDLDTQRSGDAIDQLQTSAPPSVHEQQEIPTSPLFAYLPTDTIIVVDEPLEIQEFADSFMQRLDNPRGLYPVDSLIRQIKGRPFLELSRFGGQLDPRPIRFNVESVQRFDHHAPEIIAQLDELASTQQATIYCDNAAEQQRFTELFSEHRGQVPANLDLKIGYLHRGFHYRFAHWVAIGHHELFGRYQQRRRIRKVHTARPIDSFLDLEKGDYVVHVAHGIARFGGMARMKRDGKEQEFLSLQFADRATLHVPASRIDLVQKYVGSARERPNLSKLGGTMWSKQKQRVAEAVADLAAELLEVQAKRKTNHGVAYAADSDWQREFEREFLYTETEDQLTALGQIKRDMERNQPMDRLLCGDVGYGKTELAIRAAFKVAEFGKQVAVLVPTTVLAEQHYRTFSERLADYPFTIESISRFRTKAQQADIVKRTNKGQVDILIGTHRLLSEDVRFKDLGLLVIDEEQRFGVEHKERFKRLRSGIDVLTLSATPIPRTLHMSMLGVRDISSLATAPQDRRAIVTEVIRYDRQRIRAAINRELNRDGQVYFVHNRVYNIVSIADEVQQLVPEARVSYGHGQMSERELEKRMHRFINREIDVLVCTTIIESGLDIPNANTMIINDADRFGLADLHQLRGRVGRYKHRAYAYFLLAENTTLSPVAARRLKAIEEYSQLGAGFRIAMRDLEIRGAGNILGPEQSGHIATVGYEMYCQLLDGAVKKLTGQEDEIAQPSHVDLGTDSFVPASYMHSDRQRLDFYRRLTQARSVEALEQLEHDVIDAFGEMPAQVSVLMQIAEIRVRATQWGIRSVVLKDPDIVFTSDAMEKVGPLFNHAAGKVRLVDQKTVHWRLPSEYLQRPTLLTVLRKQLTRSQQEKAEFS